MKKIICLILSLVLLLSLTACGSGLLTYKSALDGFFDVISGEANKSKLKNMLPSEVWEHMEDEYDMDFDDFADEYEDNKEDLVDELESMYGDNVKISYTVEDEDELDEDELDELREELDYYGIDEDDVKQAYELELTVTAEGEDDSEEEEMTVTAIKIGNKWYIYELLYFLL